MKSKTNRTINLTSSDGIMNIIQLINAPTNTSWHSKDGEFHISITVVETSIFNKIDIAFYQFGSIQYRLFGTHHGDRKINSYTEATVKSYSNGNDKCIQFSTYKREPTIHCQIENDEIFIDTDTKLDDIFQYSTISDNFALSASTEDIKELIYFSLRTDKKYQDYTIIQYCDGCLDDMVRMLNESIHT